MTPTGPDSITRIRQQLLAAQVALNPPLAASDVHEFEKRHGVTLPDDYREFLLRVANGGEFGPEYGILPLGLLPGHDYRHSSRYAHLLASPFPLISEWVWEDEQPSEERDRRISHTALGQLLLGEEGCGAYWALVISGACRGEVWLATGEGMTPCKPRLDFVDWLGRLMTGGLAWWATLVSHWGPYEGAFFLSHAAKQAASIRPNAPIEQSTPLCRDCMDFFRKVAVHQGVQQTVTDPYAVRVFDTTGEMHVLSRH